MPSHSLEHKRASFVYHFDGLLWARGLAALTVVLAHFAVGKSLADYFNIPWLRSFAISGNYPVFFFFCLSGYLMAKVISQHYAGNAWVFYYNRIVRIAPLYYLAVFLPMLLEGTSFDFAKYWQVLIFNTDQVSTYQHGYDPNGALWSLSVEMKFYALVPVIFVLSGYFFRLCETLLVAGLLVKILCYMRFGMPEIPYVSQYYSLSGNLFYFMAGWLSFKYRSSIPRLNIYWALVVFLAVLSGIEVFDFFHYAPGVPVNPFSTFSWSVAIPMILSITAFWVMPSLDSPEPSTGILSDTASSVLNFFGVTSYSVYVLHMLFLDNIAPAIPVLWRVVIVYLISYAIYALYEKPLFALRVRQVRFRESPSLHFIPK